MKKTPDTPPGRSPASASLEALGTSGKIAGAGGSPHFQGQTKALSLYEPFGFVFFVAWCKKNTNQTRLGDLMSTWSTEVQLLKEMEDLLFKLVIGSRSLFKARIRLLTCTNPTCIIIRTRNTSKILFQKTKSAKFFQDPKKTISQPPSAQSSKALASPKDPPKKIRRKRRKSQKTLENQKKLLEHPRNLENPPKTT